MKELLNILCKYNARPPLFERGEEKFWDDPHISKGMLEAHLDPHIDAASRNAKTIDNTVKHWFDTGVLKPGMKVLDLGCGPGLYAEKLCQAGCEVTGVDISPRSVQYAQEKAQQEGLRIDYRCMNFFDIQDIEVYDAVIQVYGELCAFSDSMRGKLLHIVKRALKGNGRFIFDVTTRTLRKKDGLRNRWYFSGGGFWSPGRHLVLEQGFDYPSEEVWLDQYIVIEEQGIKTYRNWFHDYSLGTINAVLDNAGFCIKHAWNDLAGASYADNGDWIAIVAEGLK